MFVQEDGTWDGLLIELVKRPLTSTGSAQGTSRGRSMSRLNSRTVGGWIGGLNSYGGRRNTAISKAMDLRKTT